MFPRQTYALACSASICQVTRMYLAFLQGVRRVITLNTLTPRTWPRSVTLRLLTSILPFYTQSAVAGFSLVPSSHSPLDLKLLQSLSSLYPQNLE